MKKLLLILFIVSFSFISKGAIHQIQVWNGYYQFLPPNNITVHLGDTIQWIPLDPPTMTHTITSDSIPAGAGAFNQIWQLPADTFFQYIPQVVGLYKYVCTPHIHLNMIGEFTVVNGINSQQTYIPDDNFEVYLEANGMGNGILYDDSVFTSAIDTLTYLDVSAIGIFDLTGIEDFKVLTYLNCSYNHLTSLDLSSNTALVYLNCWDNNLITLNVNSNTSLDTLECGKNQLTSLDVSQNTNLIFLRCFINQLTYLDVTQNTNLNVLRCANNQLTSLDVSQNTALTWLSCDMNGLTSLDIDQNTSLVKLQCFSNQITTLDLSQNTSLTYLRCYNNQLTSLDMRNGNNINVIDFNTINNPNLTCIDVDDSTWSLNNWTVANGVLCYLDPQHYYSNNCPSITPSLCDSVIISFNQMDTATNPNLIYFDVEVFGYGPNVGYPGFVLLNNLGDTIAYENINTAGNVFTLMPNAIETRFLDVVQNFSLPFSGFLHLLDSWFAGNPSTACIYPFNINIGTTGINVIDKNKNVIKIIDLLGRDVNGIKDQFMIYIYHDGTVEKKIIIE